MITNDDILNMNFYKKEKFTGSYLGMRYLIQKATEEVPAENSSDTPGSVSDDSAASDTPVTKVDIFRVTNWPGPYNFASTDDKKKTTATFPFTPEGKEAVVAWLNEQWKARQDEWEIRES